MDILRIERTLPQAGPVREVEEAWCDYNGHLNMAWYGVLFERALDDMLEDVGLGADWRARTGGSFFALATMHHYLREVLAGEHVRIVYRVLDFDTKKVHAFFTMLHEEKGFRAATMEILFLHVNMTTRRSAEMDADTLAVFRRLRESTQNLPWPPEAGAKIGIRRKRDR